MTKRSRFSPLMVIAVLFAALTLSASAARADAYPLLRESIDPWLQAQLAQLVEAQGLKKAAGQQRLTLALVDITDLKKPRMAAVNGDVMKYAASLPKIAILLTAFVQIEEGKLALDEKLEADMTKMIRNSSNPAATRVLDLVGRDEVTQTLQAPRFLFYDPRYNGGIWVGKAYARDGAYQRDPLHQISHGITAIQVARFYYLLTTERLVGPALTVKMKAILSQPAIRHKFVQGLKDHPEARLYRKSGTWKNFHADSALVEYNEHAYIMVGLAEDPQGGKWLEMLAAPLQALVIKNPPKE